MNNDIKLLLNNAVIELWENEKLKEKIESKILHLKNEESNPIPSNIRSKYIFYEAFYSRKGYTFLKFHSKLSLSQKAWIHLFFIFQF